MLLAFSDSLRYQAIMSDKSIEDLARKLAESVPEGLRAAKEDLESGFRSVLTAGLSKLDLVTREEFDVQQAVLARTREKLEALEKRLAMESESEWRLEVAQRLSRIYETELKDNKRAVRALQTWAEADPQALEPRRKLRDLLLDMHRYREAVEVLDALATTDTGNALFNWNALTPTLTALLTADVPDDPPVRLNAIRALANIGDAAAMGPLVDYFGKAGGPALKAASGFAIAAICHNSPQMLDDAAFQTLLTGTGSDAILVRASAFAALGSAQLTAEQALACAQANRPTAGGGGSAE